ncbi:MAG: M48 family metallopeptidase [Bacteroidales bacterium]|nr:M48 family metallopeptidase [Bacteroidales bacterium]
MSSVLVVVTRRRTSRLSIRINKEGEVHVSAPRYVSKRVIEEFIAGHKDWIESARARVAARQQKREAFYAQLDVSTPAKRKEAAARLQQKVAPMLESHAQQMGVKPAAVSFRATKSRWGSCNTKTGRISLSTYLLLLPDWCIEHVVVHELAHLLVPDHGPRFYAVMDRHFPRWREARRFARQF